IAAEVVVRLRESPRNREARDDSAFDALRFVCPQHGGADLIETRSLLWRDTVHEPRVPGSPRPDVLSLRLVEVLEQRDEGVLARLHRGRPESERHHERSV